MTEGYRIQDKSVIVFASLLHLFRVSGWPVTERVSGGTHHVLAVAAVLSD